MWINTNRSMYTTLVKDVQKHLDPTSVKRNAKKKCLDEHFNNIIKSNLTETDYSMWTFISLRNS